MEEPEIIDEEQPLLHEMHDVDQSKPPSLADQLAARRAEIIEGKEVFLPLSGYEEFGVQIKHRLLDRKQVEGIAKRVLGEVRDRGERNMRILSDIIVHSTDGFYIQNGGEQPSEITDDRRNDQPVTNWIAFAYYLGCTIPEDRIDHRTAIDWVFGGNEFAIGQYGMLLNRWMSNTGLKVEEEFLGEAL